ncbi:DUF4336 domain-containing protein [Polyangium jinanense]|uniref:DUF4336 domain-containing protein n=1 Tax=Polyangium jinanense TaxID=2829994 RepID=A0A9X3X5T7_9BACT|nr:DUF4336 domain-containing protein [Polyangium jinanense]MDC3956714.1 DUF4336 domain-containing protein [Polyangium jinanense]MDC3984777.1 DUF4336 domain-containing protein [Polyangium jinanense]
MAELVSLAEDLWAAEHPVKMPGGVRMDTRMTVVRLPGEKLWVHSPIPIDDTLAAELTKLGKISYLVAPNLYHNLFLGRASERFPEARVFAPPGLEKKIPSLRIDEVLSADTPATWADVFTQRLVEGAPQMQEVAFLHRPSKTLVVSDLLFNIERPEGLATKVVLTMMGTRGKLARSRMWNFITKDKAAWRASVREVVALDFDRLIMAHGEVVASGAKARVNEALGPYV